MEIVVWVQTTVYGQSKQNVNYLIAFIVLGFVLKLGQMSAGMFISINCIAATELGHLRTRLKESF